MRGTVLPGTGSKLESRRVTRVNAGSAIRPSHAILYSQRVCQVKSASERKQERQEKTTNTIKR